MVSIGYAVALWILSKCGVDVSSIALIIPIAIIFDTIIILVILGVPVR